jgi:hypothetical protein
MSENPNVNSEFSHNPVRAIDVMSVDQEGDVSKLYNGVQIVGIRKKDIKGSKITVFDLQKADGFKKWEVYPTDNQVNKYEEELNKLESPSK